MIASSVFDTGDGLAVVDTGPGSTLGALEAGLAGLGAALADVRHVLLTHIHFDHAGAAGTVLDRVPQARAYVHERGAAHLSRPERLLASATQIYGEHMDTLWGTMQPIDPARLTVLSGGETLTLGDLPVRVFYTPGHAVHHVSYHAGDHLSWGRGRHPAGRCPDTPRAHTAAGHQSGGVARQPLRAGDAGRPDAAPRALRAYPNTPAHWAGLRATMTADAERVRAGLSAGLDPQAITTAFTEDLMHELKMEDPTLPARYDFACPPWMSVQGLLRYWARQAARGRADARPGDRRRRTRARDRARLRPRGARGAVHAGQPRHRAHGPRDRQRAGRRKPRAAGPRRGGRRGDRGARGVPRGGRRGRVRGAGHPAFGPSRAASRLEGDKAWSKAFMHRHGIPTAAHHTFSDLGAAGAHVATLTPPIVVKDAGLKAGKGVTIAHTAEEAHAALRDIFTQPGAQAVIEDFMTGQEVTVLALTDGSAYALTPPARTTRPSTRATPAP